MAFGLVGLALLMGSLDQTALATALSAIQVDLGTTLSWAGWTISIYAVGQIIAMPIAGRLSDQFGRRRVFLFAVAVFTLTSLLCALARSIELLIAVRAVQGLACGAFLTSATGIAADLFARNRDRAVALMSSIFPLGGLLGPPIGALVVASVGWQGVFVLNIPIGLLVLVLGGFLIPRSQRTPHQRIDLAGAALLITTLLAGMLAISVGGAARGPLSVLAAAAAAAGAVVAGWMLTRHLHHTSNPLVPVDLLEGRTFRSLNLVNVIFGAAALGQASLVPYYAQVRYGMDPLLAGSILTLRALGMIAASSVSVLVMRRFGPRPLLIVGALLIAGGLSALAAPPPGSITPAVWLTASTAVTGLGLGLSAPASSNAGLHLAPEHVATVSGLRGMFRQSGSIVAVGALTTLGAVSPEPGLALAFGHVALAATLALTVPLMMRLPNHRGPW